MKKMALCQKFGRLLIGAEARFSARTDVTNISTSLNSSAPTQIPAQLPSGYNAPKPFALFTKDQMTGKSGKSSEIVKIVSINWKNLSENEKQNYSERAKAIGDELRDNFEKLTDGQKKDLWDKHVEKKNKRRKSEMNMKLQKIPARLPSGYNAPKPFALFTKDQMTGQSGGPKLMKILSKNWKNLSEDEKQNYSERARKIGAELRDNFEKLTNRQKKDLWDKHVEKMNNRMKKKLQKFHAETNRPKQPMTSFMVFMKERFVKHTEPFETRDELKKFVVDMGRRWRQMTDAEKQPYVDQVQGNIAAYHMEMAEWKQKYANEIWAWKEVKAARKARDTQFTEALFEWNNDDDRGLNEKEAIHQMLLDDSTHLIETMGTQFTQAFEWNLDDDRDVYEKQRIQLMLLDDSTRLVEKRERSSDDDRDVEEETIQRMFLAISTYLCRKEISQKQRIEY